jgi:hypothetical protein
MASFVSDSIFATLKTQFEDAMRNLVSSIAEGEGLDAQHLMDKYLVNVIPATKEAKGKGSAKTRKAKVSVTPVDPDETQDPNATPMPTACSCLTAKGGPCKLKPLFGTAMCSIHTKKAEAAASAPAGSSTGPIKRLKKKAVATREEPVADDSDTEDAPRPVAPKKKRAPAKKVTDEGGAAAGSDDEAGPSAPAAPKKAAKKAKKVKSDAPVHTHELDDEVHSDCELCQTHGCPLEDVEDEYETVMSPPRTLRERLARAAVVDEFVEDDE